MEIFRLFGSIFVDNEKANKSISETDQKAQGLGSKLAGMIGTAAKWGAGITVAGSAAFGSMVALANKTTAVADEIDKLSERTGINREELQRWKYAAEQSGANVSKLETGVKKLSDVMTDAMDGNKKAQDSFAQLGISLDDLKNKSQEDIFEQVMASLADMEQGARRNALGNDLLGKSYTEMLPLLNAGSEGIQMLKDRADELGLVMSEKAVLANVKFGDTLDDVKEVFGAVINQLVTSFLPVMQQFLDWILEHMPTIKEVVSNAFKIITEIVNYIVTTVWPSLIDIFQTAYEVITAICKAWGGEIESTTVGLFDVIKNTVQNALAIVEGLIKVFGGIMTGDFGLIKEGVMKIWNSLWDWLKNTGKAIFDIGKNIVKSLWDGIKDMWSNMVSWVSNKVKSLVNMLNPFKGGGVSISGPSNIPGLASGGRVIQSGWAIVGEAGPELLQLPRGAQVTPLSKAGITININNPNILDDYGVDRLLDRIDERMAILGVK